MGKIKNRLVKRAGKKLAADYPERFSEEFSKNKATIKELQLSKRLRNQVAGYISTLNKAAKRASERQVDEGRIEQI